MIPHNHNPLVPRCVTCPDGLPLCTCPGCVITSPTCAACSVVICPSTSGPPPHKGPNSGAIAGGVVGTIIAILLGVGVYLYLKKQAKIKQGAKEKPPENTEAAAIAALHRGGTVSRRTDVAEKPTTPSASQDVELHPTPAELYRASHPTIQIQEIQGEGNPFADSASVSADTYNSTLTDSNVIPIAYVPPTPSIQDGVVEPRTPGSPGAPSRPERSPDLNIRLGGSGSPHSLHFLDTDPGSPGLRPPRMSSPYAVSQRSGVSSRASTISSASSAMDFLYDSPTIVTAGPGGVTRQVLGVVRAQVVQVPAGGLASGQGSPTGTLTPRAGNSPLRSTGFPTSLTADADPFGDASRPTSVMSTSTFGGALSEMDWPRTPGGDSRPNSVSTQGGTVIANIQSARRVVIGQPSSDNLSHRGEIYQSNLAMGPPTAITEEDSQPSRPDTPKGDPLSGRLLTPSMNRDVRLAEESDLHRRASQSSIMSSTSSKADSILAAFPFVPPSPINNSHPRSPLSVAFRAPSPSFSISSQAAAHPAIKASSPPVPQPSFLNQEPPVPQNHSRHTLGLSTFSQASTASSGLEAFPFHFGDKPLGQPDAAPRNAPRKTEAVAPSEDEGKGSENRASLDTLMLSKDLEAYPLPFDSPPPGRDSFGPGST